MADVITSVKAVLRTAGYRVGDANPGAVMPEIMEPVLAVNLERINMGDRSMVVKVTVIAPLVMGAKSCESHALEVSRALAGMNAECQMQPCQFNAKTEMFSVAVLAAFHGNVLDESWIPGIPCQVRFGTGYYLRNVVSVTAWQEPEEDQELAAAIWKIQVEEHPDAIEQDTMPTSVAKMTVIFDGRQESYDECKLTGRKRIFRDGGLVQTWEATAKNRTITI